jgi:hypothetical protein
MRASVVGFICVAIALCGCGSEDAAESPTPSPAAARCPAGTKLVTAEDLVPEPAPGYSLAPSEPDATRPIVGALRGAIGDRWRDHDEKVLVRDGATNGALVLVINHTEKAGGVGELVTGMTDSGRPSEPIRFRGQQTRLARLVDGAYLTAAVAGECAVVLLFADTERLVRDAVKQFA